MNLKHWNLLLPDCVNALDPPAQFAEYAIAYLDSAERLCSLLARSYRQATYERGSVVLFLAAHAVELFLKGAILRKKPNEKFAHDIEHIHNRYNALYPGKRYRFPNVFRTEYPGMSSTEIAAAKNASPPINELYRYPQDKTGNPWPGLYAFEANSFLKDLRSLRVAFMRLLKEFDG